MVGPDYFSISNFDAFYERLCEENGYPIEPCTEDPPAERLVTPSEGVQPSADDMWYITAWNALSEGVRARISRYSERLGSLLAGTATLNEAKSRLEDLKSSAKPFVVTHTDEEDRNLKEEWDGHGVLDHAPT